jgi:glycerol uptake facilitator-like aquaporin
LVTTLFLFIVCAVGLNVERSGHAESESLVVGALTTGFASVALIYSFADVSGAHFNPAVTFATIVTGKTTIAKGESNRLLRDLNLQVSSTWPRSSRHRCSPCSCS